jgi:hypothetical protein
MTGKERDQMTSEEAIEQLPQALRLLANFERLHLHKPEFYFKDTKFNPDYLPQNCGAFRLPCYWIRRKHFFVYGEMQDAATEVTMMEGCGPSDHVLFPVHPVYLDRLREFLAKVGAQDCLHSGRHIWAVPTASVRTLLVWQEGAPEKAVFVKTSLHDSILGSRHLSRRAVARSAGVSYMLKQSTDMLPRSFGYFAEALTFIPRSLPDNGVIIRSIPQEIRDGNTFVAPLFSLMGGGGRVVPLFLTLVERSGLGTQELLETVLCSQFCRLWLDMTFGLGLLLESHGQDLLLGLSPDLVPSGRFFSRDFDGLAIDWELRRLKGLPEPNEMPSTIQWRGTYRSYEFLGRKLAFSLNTYLHHVLHELEQALQEWQTAGLLGGPRVEPGQLTMMFSVRMRDTMSDMFGLKRLDLYDIYHALNRFAGTLLKVRGTLLGSRVRPLRV